jgi:hypothetical protein
MDQRWPGACLRSASGSRRRRWGRRCYRRHCCSAWIRALRSAATSTCASRRNQESLLPRVPLCLTDWGHMVHVAVRRPFARSCGSKRARCAVLPGDDAASVLLVRRDLSEESKQMSTLRRLKFNPACNMKTASSSALLGEHDERATEEALLHRSPKRKWRPAPGGRLQRGRAVWPSRMAVALSGRRRRRIVAVCLRARR